MHRFMVNILIIFILANCSLYKKENVLLLDTITKYNKLYFSVNNGDWHMNTGNEEGLYSWCEAYILQSLINMYIATGDDDYLKRL